MMQVLRSLTWLLTEPQDCRMAFLRSMFLGSLVTKMTTSKDLMTFDRSLFGKIKVVFSFGRM